MGQQRINELSGGEFATDHNVSYLVCNDGLVDTTCSPVGNLHWIYFNFSLSLHLVHLSKLGVTEDWRVKCG